MKQIIAAAILMAINSGAALASGTHAGGH
ncbi:copper oxidase, partial [Mesorhizobium sp. M7A.T.Ca.TU.009.01.1.2]